MRDKIYETLCNEVKLRPFDKTLGTKDKQDHECLICGAVICVTPKAKMMNFRKYGSVGCPECSQKGRYDDDRKDMTDTILAMGYNILTPIEGYKKKFQVLNTKCGCGRSWETTPQSILSGRSFCRPCNDDLKSLKFKELNTNRTSQK